MSLLRSAAVITSQRVGSKGESVASRRNVVSAGWAFAGSAVVLAVAGAVPAAVASPEQSISGDGTYRVGVDIQPGIYVSAGGTGGFACVWFRHRTLGADPSDIIDSNASRGQQIVTIAGTDATFETSSCKPWSLSGGGAQSNVAAPSAAVRTPSDLPGLKRGSVGAACPNATNFVFAIAPDGHTLACLPGEPSPKYVLSAPVVGVRSLGALCTETSQLGQSPAGQPMMCMGSPAIWAVYGDY